MKSLLYIFLFTLSSLPLKAQYHELGFFLGASNYIGDVGSDYYLMPSNSAIGIVYKWNLTTRYSIRASAINSSIKSTDYRTNDINRFRRAYSFENSLNEGSLGVEFNFVEFNLHDTKKSYSPYLYLGLSYVSFNEFYFDSSLIPIAEPIESGKGESISIPVIFGIKTNPSPYWVLGLEVGARYALTDNLDGSAPKVNMVNNQYSFGNTNNNDWYIFSGITISFTFGDLPCYCKE